MSRSLSTTLLQSLLLQHTNEVVLVLLEIEHSSWSSVIRLVNDRVDIVSNGNTYSAYPFEAILPPEDTEQPQTHTKIIFDNVDRQIIALLRDLSTEPTITMSIVLASTPDTIEYGPAEFILTGYDYDKMVITGYLSYEDVLNEPIPAHTFNPADYPEVH